MAKKVKKSGNGGQMKKLSPERYFREKVRALPLYKCYMVPGWELIGVTVVIVTRKRADGLIVCAAFKLDTSGRGVEDVLYSPDMTEERLAALIADYDRVGIEECDYVVAHNLIYGVIAYAEEEGYRPCREFAVARYILEEDTDDVELIEYEFGGGVKSFAPENSTMIKNFMSNYERMRDEDNRHPSEVFAYDYPEYPQVIDVRNRFIADALCAPENKGSLSDSDIDRILDVPVEEAVADICNVMMYEIGRTYEHVDEDTEPVEYNGALANGVIMLTELKSAAGLPVLLELLRQTDAFMEYHFGDVANELLTPALYVCGLNHVAELEDIINQPGLSSFQRSTAFEALAWIVALQPERRAEIMEVMRRHLTGLVDKLPVQDACDGLYVGLIMCTLLDIHAEELMPEIRWVFDTNCVNLNSVGNYDDMTRRMNSKSGVDMDKFQLRGAHEAAKWLRGFAE